MDDRSSVFPTVNDAKPQRNLLQKVLRALFYPLTHRLSLIRSLYFNFTYFPFRVAIQLPVFVYRGVRFNSTRGKIFLDFRKIEPGCIRIGKKSYGFHSRYHRTIWEHNGGVILFGQQVKIGKGTFISVGANGFLRFGNYVKLGGNDMVICNRSIHLGDHTLVAWDVRIIDTDFHRTVNTVFRTSNCVEKPITVGEYNWLGFGCVILKGTVTPNRCIVSASTTLRNDYSKAGENIVLGQEESAKVTAKYIHFEEDPSEDADVESLFDNVINLRNKKRAM
jgi:acetyltransferase-like isoleucine patch superfamily enzyme